MAKITTEIKIEQGEVRITIGDEHIHVSSLYISRTDDDLEQHINDMINALNVLRKHLNDKH